MAKKAEETKVALTPISPLVLDNGAVSVDKADVLAIAVSRAETQLADLVKVKNELSKKLEKSFQDLFAEASQEAVDLVKPKAEADLAILEQAFIPFSGTEGGNNGSVVKLDLNLTTSVDQQKKLGRVVVRVNSSIRGHLSEVLVPFPEAPAAKLVKSFDLQEEARLASLEALEARKRLQNIGTLERQMKARLAEAALARTEGGQALLELLTTDLNKAIDALPSL